MYSNLSLGALGLSADFPTAVDLAVKHGFGGVDADLDHLRDLGDQAAIRDAAAGVSERGLQWGVAGLPLDLTAPASQFTAQLANLPDTLNVLTAAGVTSVGTWVRPMHDDLTYRRNWVLHVSRLQLVAEVLADAGVRLGLEYVGPKTFWSTERFPFIHSLSEVRELIAETGATNIGVILDTYHWYTAGESAPDLEGLRDADIVSVDINDARDDRERDEQLDLDRRLPGATGVIDLAGFMSGLRNAGYTGPVKVEPFMKSLAEQPIDDVLADVSTRLNTAIG
ncbi:MAG: sugar phosphate isomerase/epimerase family protein [Propionibacteriaceae bacterium]